MSPFWVLMGIWRRTLQFQNLCDSHPFHSTSIGHPIPETRLYQTLTLKLQGQGRRCGQRARSYSWPSILSIRFLFISHQSDQQFLRYSYFEIYSLKHPKSRSWVRSMVKVPIYTQYPTDALPFFHINPTNHSWDMAKIAFDLEKTHLKILKKIAKITVFHRTSPKSNHDKGNMATTFYSDWMSGFYFIIQTSKFFANWCHSHDLGSRSWKGHPVHFYRLIYLLSQISKI